MPPATHPQLRRFVRRTVEGVQRPPVFEADDGYEYVLKLDNHDVDFPAAELVAAQLAGPLTVSIPPFAVLAAPAALTNAFADTGDPDLIEFAESFDRRGGLCFGSRYLPGVIEKWAARMRYAVPGADEFLARVLVFDAYIENGDRTSADNPNLLATPAGLFAIDHGQALPAVQGITGKRLGYSFDSHIGWSAVVERPALLDAPIAKLSVLPDAAIDAAIDVVPAGWWTSTDRADLARADLRIRRDQLPATLNDLRVKLS